MKDKIKEGKNKIIRINWDDRSKFHPDRSGIPGIELVSLPMSLERVWSRGKVLIFENILSGEKEEILYFVSQFGMAGYWTCIDLDENEVRAKGTSKIIKELKEHPVQGEYYKHSNFWLVLGGLSHVPEEREQNLYLPNCILFYNDARHFGNFTITKDLSPIWKKHGPCLMAAAIQRYAPHTLYLQNLQNTNNKENKKEEQKDTEFATLERLRQCIKGKRIENKWIFDFLLEQKHVSGIGNYLCNEILYASKISPFRKLKDITEDEIVLIFDNALEIIYRSYTDQGPVNGYIEGGKFQLKVYQQDFDPLGNLVIKDTQSAKRTIHYVPSIQL